MVISKRSKVLAIRYLRFRLVHTCSDDSSQGPTYPGATRRKDAVLLPRRPANVFGTLGVERCTRRLPARGIGAPGAERWSLTGHHTGYPQAHVGYSGGGGDRDRGGPTQRVAGGGGSRGALRSAQPR